ncbi:MAG: type II toxin-antitoxin system VapC family toxin [Chloroflexota bacterium]
MEQLAKVLDSWAILAFFEGEPATEAVEKLVRQSIQDRTGLLITSVNLGEVWYSVARTRGENAAGKAIQNVRSLDIEIIPADWELSLQAARFKAQNPIAYADCFAAALAHLRGVELVTGDHEFERLQHQIHILWVA